MPVPKASVYKNNSLISEKDKIGAARQSLIMEPVPQTFTVERVPD